jgi:hypothetical protein
MLPESCKATTAVTIMAVVFMAVLPGSPLTHKPICARDL